MTCLYGQMLTQIIRIVQDDSWNENIPKIMEFIVNKFIINFLLCCDFAVKLNGLIPLEQIFGFLLCKQVCVLHVKEKAE